MSATTDELVAETEARHTQTSEDGLPSDGVQAGCCVVLTCLICTGDGVEDE